MGSWIFVRLRPENSKQNREKINHSATLIKHYQPSVLAQTLECVLLRKNNVVLSPKFVHVASSLIGEKKKSC